MQQGRPLRASGGSECFKFTSAGETSTQSLPTWQVFKFGISVTETVRVSRAMRWMDKARCENHRVIIME